MRSLAFACCGLLLAATVAWGGAPQNGKFAVLGGATSAGDTQISSSTNYRFHGPFSGLSDSSPHDVELVLPVGGTISRLNVGLHDTPDNGGAAWTFVFMVNAAAGNPPTGDTLLMCTVATGATDCSDLVNQVNVNAGDKISLMSVPSCKNPNFWGPLTGNCPNRRQMRWSVLFTP